MLMLATYDVSVLPPNLISSVIRARERLAGLASEFPGMPCRNRPNKRWAASHLTAAPIGVSVPARY